MWLTRLSWLSVPACSVSLSLWISCWFESGDMGVWQRCASAHELYAWQQEWHFMSHDVKLWSWRKTMLFSQNLFQIDSMGRGGMSFQLKTARFTVILINVLIFVSHSLHPLFEFCLASYIILVNWCNFDRWRSRSNDQSTFSRFYGSPVNVGEYVFSPIDHKLGFTLSMIHN